MSHDLISIPDIEENAIMYPYYDREERDRKAEQNYVENNMPERVSDSAHDR